MSFSTILLGTLVVYAIYYSANIIYDLFVAGANTDTQIEEEISISEEENTLSDTSFYSDTASIPLSSGNEKESEPIVPSPEYAEIPSPTVPQEETFSEPTMNGALEIDDLIEQVQKSETPDDLLYIANTWHS